YEVIIIGGGPAGVAAGVYAARKKMKCLLLTGTIGGSSSVSATIENWIGEPSITGVGFGQRLEAHLRAQEGIDIRTDESVTDVRKKGDATFDVTTETGETFETKSVIVASGVRHRHLGVPGEDLFQGKGVAFCSTCDAPFFRNKSVAVVGGGNSALEAVEDLLPYATKVTILTIDPEFTGDPVLRDQVLGSEKVSAVRLGKSEEIVGERKVTALRYEDLSTGEHRELPCDGVFVEIGMMPNSEPARNLVECTRGGEIIVNPRTFETSCPGIFAAGDVTDQPYRQNNISAGQGAVAALSAYDFIRGAGAGNPTTVVSGD
ncbi:MAG: FAD-dependent oxidoreductase, partial [Candidatus Moranbacteria bacterium]|nr:FAD-dependent oxidoreductase [Candidatus Moranbacteria bacterium]